MLPDSGAMSTEASPFFPVWPHLAKRRKGLAEESSWRCAEGLNVKNAGQAVIVSRWLDCRESPREAEAGWSDGRYVVSLALKPARITLNRHNAVVFDGLMPAGMLHLSMPKDGLRARFQSQCDFVHFYLTEAYYQECRELAEAGPDCASVADRDVLVRDNLAEHLGRTLVEGDVAGHEAYAESVGRTIVMRLIGAHRSPSRTSALSKWRLRRVNDYVSSHIEKTITLSDLAGAAGLSRMHFAAQFKAATGFSPRDFVQHHRIECAKQTILSGNLPLAQVALCVGFQAQAHFTTVFKKLTGDTPARWREASLDRPWHSLAAPSSRHKSPNLEIGALK